MKSDKTKPEKPPARVTFTCLTIARARYGGYFVFSPPEGATLYAGKMAKCLNFIAGHIENRPEDREPDISEIVAALSRKPNRLTLEDA